MKKSRLVIWGNLHMFWKRHTQVSIFKKQIKVSEKLSCPEMKLLLPKPQAWNTRTPRIHISFLPVSRRFHSQVLVYQRQDFPHLI